MTQNELEPVAYKHTLHMELDQEYVKVTHNETNPFGVAGKDYDETYRYTAEPLYTRAKPAVDVPENDFADIHKTIEKQVDNKDALEALDWVENYIDMSRTWQRVNKKDLWQCCETIRKALEGDDENSV